MLDSSSPYSKVYLNRLKVLKSVSVYLVDHVGFKDVGAKMSDQLLKMVNLVKERCKQMFHCFLIANKDVLTSFICED